MGGIAMTRHIPKLFVSLAAVFILGWSAASTAVVDQFDIAKIFFEYNSTANDLGVHVFLDGEDWRELSISDPRGRTIFEVEGKRGYAELGLTELFFEGAEPSLDEVPLEELLDLFPEGRYTFRGVTVDGNRLVSRAMLSHAIPAGPVVSAQVRGNTVIISWDGVTGPPEGFPNRRITIVGYQVIVGSFQVTLPASARKVTVPPEFVASLESGEHDFEVLAIEASGNQTITEGSFTKP
jgi:hypothetical protein